MRRRPELNETLAKAFSDLKVAEILADQAGIANSTFPDPQGNMKLNWEKVVEVMTQQGKLLALVQTAAQESFRDDYKDVFKRIAAEISVHELLLTLITESGLAFPELRPLYYKSFSDDVNPDDAQDADSMIFNLLGYRDRRALLRFMRRIAGKTTNAMTRDAIYEWFEKEDTPLVLNLTRSDLDTMRQSIEPTLRQCRRYLMVVVEDAQRGSAETYLVSLYSGLEDGSIENISRQKVTALTLEPYLIKELDDAFLKFAPLEADAQDEAIRTIEFYLPSSLMAKTVEPHLWDVSNSKLMRKATVVIGITERHFALNIVKMKQRKIQEGQRNEPEYKKLNRALNKDKRMSLLGNSALEWVRRWKSLNAPSGKLFKSIVGRIDHDQTISLQSLHDRFDRQEGWACVVFAFSCNKLKSVEFGALLDEALGVGLPIILWTYGPGVSDSDAHQLTSTFLQQQIFDKYGNKEIGSAAEIVELFHSVRKGTFEDVPAAANVGEHLTILLDNPDRKIPQLQRTPK